MRSEILYYHPLTDLFAQGGTHFRRVTVPQGQTLELALAWYRVGSGLKTAGGIVYRMPVERFAGRARALPQVRILPVSQRFPLSTIAVDKFVDKL